jgi:hypothetical protein
VRKNGGNENPSSICLKKHYGFGSVFLSLDALSSAMTIIIYLKLLCTHRTHGVPRHLSLQDGEGLRVAPTWKLKDL